MLAFRFPTTAAAGATNEVCGAVDGASIENKVRLLHQQFLLLALRFLILLLLLALTVPATAVAGKSNKNTYTMHFFTSDFTYIKAQ